MSISSLGGSLLATLFKKADADDSGTLTAQELNSVAADLSATTGKTQTGAQLAQAYDADRDGTVSAQEFEDGATLDANVHAALLKAQEITSGATLIGYMNGNDSESDPLASLFGSGANAGTNPLLAPSSANDSSSDDALTALFEQLMANYADGAQSLAETDEEPTTPVTATNT